MNMPNGRQPLGQPSLVAIALLFISLSLVWLGVNAIWGLTSPSPTAASQWMSNFAPLTYWFGCSLALLALIGFTSGFFTKQNLVVPVSMLMAFVIGVAGAEYAQIWVDPQGPIVHRLFVLYAAIPMIGVWLAFPQHRAQYPLRIGAWTQRNSRWPLFVTALFIAAIAVLCVRLAIDLNLLSDEWWPHPATIVALSALNGFTEELLFRGLIFSALAIAVGLRWGIILQALLFGFIHLGSSEAWIGELFAAIYLVPLGAYFAFAAYKRNGLAWVVGIHALLDVGSLSLLSMSQG